MSGCYSINIFCSYIIFFQISILNFFLLHVFGNMQSPTERGRLLSERQRSEKHVNLIHTIKIFARFFILSSDGDRLIQLLKKSQCEVVFTFKNHTIVLTNASIFLHFIKTTLQKVLHMQYNYYIYKSVTLDSNVTVWQKEQLNFKDTIQINSATLLIIRI